MRTESISRKFLPNEHRDESPSGVLARGLFRVDGAFLLLALFAIIYIAQKRDVSIEAAQTVLFPLFLLAFARLPASADLRIPSRLTALALCCWGFSALNIRGYVPNIGPSNDVLLTPLRNDPQGVHARELFRRYNAIADAYALPRMKILLRAFPQKPRAREWLAHSAKGALLVGGEPEWLQLALRGAPFDVFPSADESAMELVAEEAKRWGIELDDRVKVIAIPGVSAPMVIATLPESLDLPGEPSELSRHFLGWLGRILGEEPKELHGYGDAKLPLGRDPQFRQLQRVAYRVDAMSQATMMLGSWRSPEPLSAARFLLGTEWLLEAIQEQGNEEGAIGAAAETLKSAGKLLRNGHNELLSLIRNNNNVIRFLRSSSEEDFTKLRREMLVVASMEDERGRTTTGAKLSMLNLVLLEGAGLL